MTAAETLALQAYSDRLRENPRDLPAGAAFRIAECLACEEVDSTGAGFAARIEITDALAALPVFSFAAIKSLSAECRALLLAYLEYDVLIDEVVERLLTRLRRALFVEILSGGTPDGFGFDLLAAFATFCFGNQFIFAEGEMETKALQILEQRGTLATVGMLACYRPLKDYSHLAAAWETEGVPPSFKRLVATQVTEPLEERAIAALLPSFSSIEDGTSTQVRAMYEAYPYPRWRYLRAIAESGIHQIAGSILVAGCGSGQHAILTARYNPLARITAMDLSRASLAYGYRKARNHGITNIDFTHGDILALSHSGLQFDAISCVGVLHHMASPESGLDAVYGVLAPGGTLELGLYTESGRKEVVAAIALRDQLSIPPTDEGVRRFRQIIYELPSDHPAKRVIDSLDFFSMAGCRDFLFHVMEHRTDLLRVNALLKARGLVVTRVDAPADIQERFLQRHTNPNDLTQWAEFEAVYPGIFGSMYNIWAVKTGTSTWRDE